MLLNALIRDSARALADCSNPVRPVSIKGASLKLVNGNIEKQIAAVVCCNEHWFSLTRRASSL